MNKKDGPPTSQPVPSSTLTEMTSEAGDSIDWIEKVVSTRRGLIVTGTCTQGNPGTGTAYMTVVNTGYTMEGR